MSYKSVIQKFHRVYRAWQVDNSRSEFEVSKWQAISITTPTAVYLLVSSVTGWTRSRLAPVLKTFFHQYVISYTCSQSNSDTEPSELDWLQVYYMTHRWKNVLRTGASLDRDHNGWFVIDASIGDFNLSKQCRFWWNAALCCISSGPSLFATVPVWGFPLFATVPVWGFPVYKWLFQVQANWNEKESDFFVKYVTF